MSTGARTTAVFWCALFADAEDEPDIGSQRRCDPEVGLSHGRPDPAIAGRRSSPFPPYHAVCVPDRAKEVRHMGGYGRFLPTGVSLLLLASGAARRLLSRLGPPERSTPRCNAAMDGPSWPTTTQ